MLGINTVYIEGKIARDYGLERTEICPRKGGTRQERQKKMEDEIYFTDKENHPYSIHLPVYLFDWFKGHDLDAWFLDPQKEKADISLRLLEENLKRLENTGVEYVVTHFSGVYPHAQKTEDFQRRLTKALIKIEEMAKKYNIFVCIEYMGGNRGFWKPKDWIKETKNLSHVGILLDTGHLYFSSILNGFSFEEGFKTLLPIASAFHFWTIKGKKAYGESEAYRKFHHIMPRKDQKLSDGWAFDTETIFLRMAQTRKPIILEASKIYGGEDYFYKGIEEMVALYSNHSE